MRAALITSPTFALVCVLALACTVPLTPFTFRLIARGNLKRTL